MFLIYCQLARFRTTLHLFFWSSPIQDSRRSPGGLRPPFWEFTSSVEELRFFGHWDCLGWRLSCSGLSWFFPIYLFFSEALFCHQPWFLRVIPHLLHQRWHFRRWAFHQSPRTIIGHKNQNYILIWYLHRCLSKIHVNFQYWIGPICRDLDHSQNELPFFNEGHTRTWRCASHTTERVPSTF